MVSDEHDFQSVSGGLNFTGAGISIVGRLAGEANQTRGTFSCDASSRQNIHPDIFERQSDHRSAVSQIASYRDIDAATTITIGTLSGDTPQMP